MDTQTLESILVCTKPVEQETKKPRPQPEEALKCPRCDSTNTKFCYYNNYSLSQPRYFCKSCRRYWTKGGTLRNVPVGGGCRKGKSRSSPPSSSSKITSNLINSLSNLPSLSYDPNDVSQESARLHKREHCHDLSFDHDSDFLMLGSQNELNGDQYLGNLNFQASTATAPTTFFDAIRASGYLEAPIGFHNLYYGMGGNASHEEMGFIPHEDMGGGTRMKQEQFSNGGKNEEEEEKKKGVLLGFPWQLVGADGDMGDIDSSGRGSWNGLIGSSWHGLLNSPLM
ncbi:hypothetical protein U1Q18_020948 [Sarracenia purpurea var. burkii]